MAFIGNTPISVAFLTDTFSGDGSTTAFTMTVAPANTSSILVAVTGVVQDPSTYSVSGTTLTFSAAPPSGTSNISVRYLGIPASGVTTTAYRTVTDFTATAGQTSFSVPSYTIGYIDVYRNGVRLVSTDYTATTGTTVVLNNACTVGDAVVTESFYVSSVLNAIPATAGAVNSTYLTDGAVTQAKLGTGVAGNGPAFSAYQSSAQTLSTNTSTKITYDVEEFDTNSNFASSRFTPTVAGYYNFSAAIQMGVQASIIVLTFFKNGSAAKVVGQTSTATLSLINGSALIYCNGTTDYVEVYATLGTGQALYATSSTVYFQGVMVRAA
jgi:hypothetical protein